MVYQIHLRCDANVTDDSGGNVYAMAMTANYLGTTGTRNTIKNFMLGNLDQPFVVNIGQIIAEKDTVTPVSNILTQYVPSIDDTAVEDLHLHEYYTVYVLAVDGKGNPSDVYNGHVTLQPTPNLRGNIAARLAPVETDQTLSYAPLGGVTYTANLESNVYFEYILATFTSDVGEAVVTTFFDGILDDTSPVDSRLYVYANVHSGYTGFSSAGWDRAKESIENVVMGNVIANIADVTEYHPYVDKTQPLHTYLYAVNHHPHKTSLMSVSPIVQDALQNIQIVEGNVGIFIKDNSFEISFDIRQVDPANITAYVGVFDTPKTNIDVSGDEKRDLIENYVHLFDSASLSATGTVTNHEITQFYNGIDHANIVNKDTYHVYVMLFDTNTGETSAIFRQENITIGQFPLLARNDGTFLDNLLVTRENTSVTSNVEQNVREQSDFSAYFGLFDADTVDDVDAVNFMVNNYANVTGTVFANIDVLAPTAENELWPIPKMEFQSYQWNLGDPTSGFKAINVTSNTKLVTYIVDETSANVTYVTDIPALSAPIVVPVSIEITRALDDGFELVCANAEANIVNYVMAFNEFVPFDKFENDGVFVDNLKTNATLQIANVDTFLLTQVHDITATEALPIENGGSYHIYSYALQLPEGVYGLANIDDVAKHVPIISYVHVNFDQFATSA